MNGIRGIICCLCLSAIAAYTFAVSKVSSEPPTLSRVDRIIGLERIYRTAKQSFAGFERVPELDWDNAFAEFLPIIEKDEDLVSYYRNLQKFTALLNDGHSDIRIPGTISARLRPLPLNLEIVEGKVVVGELSLFSLKTPAGTVVESINGEEPLKFLRKSYDDYVGPKREELLLEKLSHTPVIPAEDKLLFGLLYPNGEKQLMQLAPSVASKPPSTTSGHEQDYLLPWHRRRQELDSEILAGGLLYVRYPSCEKRIEEDFCKLIASEKIVSIKAVLVDLRGNPGGNTPVNAMGHLISAPIKYFKCRTRCSIGYTDAQAQNQRSNQLEGVVKLSREWLPPLQLSGNWLTFTPELHAAESHYDGPLFFLTNHETGSAAEDFVGPLQFCGRATVIGEPTSGSSGQPIELQLPGSGLFRICTMDLSFPDGATWIGKGIQPNVPCHRTLRGVIAGKDDMKEFAIEYVRRTLADRSKPADTPQPPP